MTYTEWCDRRARIREAADRVRALTHARYVRLCREAHLEPGCVLHNALLALEQGKPWREVDYSKARAARRAERAMFEPSAILERWDRRVGLPTF